MHHASYVMNRHGKRQGPQYNVYVHVNARCPRSQDEQLHSRPKDVKLRYLVRFTYRTPVYSTDTPDVIQFSPLFRVDWH